MAAYQNVPGSMSLILKAGDDAGTLVDFDVSLDGRSVSSELYSLVTGQKIADIQATIPDSPAGKVNISLPASQTGSIPPGSYGWRLSWSSSQGGKRTVLEGVAEVVR